MIPNFPAHICLFPSDQGGRGGPYRSNSIRLNVVFPQDAERMHFGAELISDDCDNIGLGEIIRVQISFFNDAETSEKCIPGASFELFEGTRRVGVGTWIQTEDL
jgi:hypothetical protein